RASDADRKLLLVLAQKVATASSGDRQRRRNENGPRWAASLIVSESREQAAKRLATVSNGKRICYFCFDVGPILPRNHQDMDGVSHTVEVTAATLYEAVAQGLAAIRRNEWVAGIAQGFNVVKVSVADVRVEHEVKLGDFTKWLDRTGGSPREVSDRYRIRSILGMPVSRQKVSAVRIWFIQRDSSGSIHN